MKNKQFSRRSFLKKTAISGGMVSAGTVGWANHISSSNDFIPQSPREVWIAAISQMELKKESFEDMMAAIDTIIRKIVHYQPDIICLPEAFATSNINKNFTLSEKLELSSRAIEKMMAIAKKNSCYIICPVYTSENGNNYNSAVVINRNGNKTGEYHKMHLTEGEIDKGLTPGALTPPVFDLDIGRIGVQICFDMMWDDGWMSLDKQGAEIVFWPSAFAGGKMVNTKAWHHKYVVASSTRKNTSKLCDISGEVISKTGIWDKNYFCAPVNLEKAFLHTWPFVQRFDEIRKKYGRKVRITNFHEEEWSIIESLSPEIFVNDILKEFDLKTYKQHAHDSEKAQVKARKS